MNPIPRELYLVDLGLVGKVRPTVIVSREDPHCPRSISICAPLTTQHRGTAYEVPVGKLRFLEKESWINVQGLMSIGHERLLRRLGRINAGQLDAVKAALKFTLEL